MGDQRSPGWEMDVMCDGFGNAFGCSRNQSENAERKYYSGRLGLQDGVMDIITTFESGQQIGYRGQLDPNAMDPTTVGLFEGTIKVLSAGNNAAAFKPVVRLAFICLGVPCVKMVSMLSIGHCWIYRWSRPGFSYLESNLSRWRRALQRMVTMGRRSPC